MIWQKCKSWRELHKVKFLLIFIFLISAARAQFDEPEFFKIIKENYYNLEDSEIDNFSAWITSSDFQKITGEFYSQEIFPLELIWVKPNDIYFIRRPLPVIADSIKNDQAIRAQRDIQLDLRNLLEDWLSFYSGRLLADMPVNYQIVSQGDSVILLFSGEEESFQLTTRLSFSTKGLLTKYEQSTRDSLVQTTIWPEYKFTGEFWLCTGWQTRVSGRDIYEVKVISQKTDKMWVPEKISVYNKNGEKAANSYDFRNVRVNRDIQVLNGRN